MAEHPPAQEGWGITLYSIVPVLFCPKHECVYVVSINMKQKVAFTAGGRMIVNGECGCGAKLILHLDPIGTAFNPQDIEHPQGE